MELKDQVCSLELAKRLKELGVNQDGFYCYFNHPDVDNLVDEENWNLLRSQLLPLSSAKLKSRMNNQACISAFTVAELGEMLPDKFPSYRKEGKFFIAWDGSFIKILFRNLTTGVKKEADARAKMLIYLLENELMELPK